MSSRGSDGVVGTEFAGYAIEALIGRGGMGTVYRAEELALRRKVALKVIAPELAQDQRFRERFLRESRVAASLDHPHVVPIFAAGREGGTLFLAMRYVEGTDLGRLLHEHGALDPAFAIPLLEQIADALDAAHGQGLVHRDVKPSNILISAAPGRRHGYLGDFGLTKRTGSLSGVSATGEIVGTLEYVAPEQITGAEVGPAADVYSFACVVYECLTGRSPFPRATDVALLWAHVHDEPEPASGVRPELPRALDAALGRALAKEPAKRHASACELVADVRAALGLHPAPLPPRRRTRRAALALVLGLAATAAALLLVTWRNGAAPTTIAPNSVGVIDPRSDHLVAEIPVGIDPDAVAVGRDAVWVANVEDEMITRIEVATRERGKAIPVGDFPTDLAIGGDAVWVALGALAELTRIDPARNTSTAAAPALGEGARCGAPRASIAVVRGAVFFLCENGELGRFDPAVSKARSVGLEAGLQTSASALPPRYVDIAFGLGSLWIVNRAANKIVEVDPATNQQVQELSTGRSPSAVAIGTGALWVANFGDDTVTRLAIAGRGHPAAPTTFPVGDGPVDVAVGEGGVWVASSGDRTVTRLDPATGDVVARIAIGNEPQRLAAGGGAIWVTVRAPGDADG